MDVEEVSCGCIDDGPARLARRNIRRWKVRRGEYWKNGAEYVYGSVDRGWTRYNRGNEDPWNTRQDGEK